jgi:hypothetical protein
MVTVTHLRPSSESESGCRAASVDKSSRRHGHGHLGVRVGLGRPARVSDDGPGYGPAGLTGRQAPSRSLGQLPGKDDAAAAALSRLQ